MFPTTLNPTACENSAGRFDEAWKTMRKLLPMVRSTNDVEAYKVEPYVWSEYVIGRANDNYGEGVFTWNTALPCGQYCRDGMDHGSETFI